MAYLFDTDATLFHDLELVTGNVKHFERVSGLRISPVLAEARTRS